MARNSKLKIKRVGLVVKLKHSGASRMALELCRILIQGGIGVSFSRENKAIADSAKKQFGSVRVVDKPKLIDHSDLIVVLGGDGTYLSIARLMRTQSVPVLGVNMGQLGFLTEVKKEEVFDVLSQIIRGAAFPISKRELLEVEVKRKNKVVFRGPVVNDAVISKGAIARIIGIQVSVNKKWVNMVRADGIIVATPTGSTAYSLAAGGPIMEPSLPALLITPICPHSLTHRPLVVSNDSVIELRLAHRPGRVLLTLDGQDVVTLQKDDVVMIRKFRKHVLKLISSPTRDYFEVVREKFKLGSRA